MTNSIFRRAGRPEKSKALLLSISAAITLTVSNASFAAWDIVPEIGTYIESNNNLRLRNIGDQSGSLALVDGRVRFTNRTQRGFFRVEPRFLKDTYADDKNSDLESDDRFLTAASRYDWRTIGVGFNADYAQQNVRRAEISDPFFQESDDDAPTDIDDPVDVETGRLIGIDQNRIRSAFRGYLDFNLSQRNSIRLDAEYIDLSYSEFEISGRTSFDDVSVGLGIVRRVDERNRVSARFYTSTYEAEENENVTDTVGVEGAFFRPLSETWTMRLTAGVERADFVFRNRNTLELVDNAAANFLAHVQFLRFGERNTIIFDAGRRANPNASGYIVIRDEFRINMTRRFTERVSGSIGYRLSQTKSLDEINTNDDRDFQRFDAYIDWALTPRLYVQAGLDYISQEFVNSELQEADSTSIRLGIYYRGQPRF